MFEDFWVSAEKGEGTEKNPKISKKDNSALVPREDPKIDKMT